MYNVILTTQDNTGLEENQVLKAENETHLTQLLNDAVKHPYFRGVRTEKVKENEKYILSLKPQRFWVSWDKESFLIEKNFEIVAAFFDEEIAKEVVVFLNVKYNNNGKI